MPILFLIPLLLLSACQKAELVKSKHGLVIRFHSSQIEEVRNIPWSVGQGFMRQQVSKGFMAAITLPDLGDEELSFLYNTKKVDSWLIKIERTTVMRGKEFLGHFMVPLKVQTQKNLRISLTTDVRFRIYYAAASVSLRFQRFPCPAFGHNLKLTDFHIHSSGSTRESLIIRSREVIKGRMETAGFVSLEFNGGSSLQGEYTISVALYNSVSKVLMSRYVLVRDSISILEEYPIGIEGCGDFVIPEKSNRNQKRSLQDIKFP